LRILEALNLVEDNFAEDLELRFWISSEKLQREADEVKVLLSLKKKLCKWILEHVFSLEVEEVAFKIGFHDNYHIPFTD